eukprot:TRINITY_DN19871_c0_g1_i1.p1 TRINITY_DN19871_c0_g1~~TRINITY_DN19871_c0_g1_i1.p1  ORF type:complete len:898 (+),score=238.05 TRINITY_DN19871_c0_g1_i1:137-2830(+)
MRPKRGKKGGEKDGHGDDVVAGAGRCGRIIAVPLQRENCLSSPWGFGGGEWSSVRWRVSDVAWRRLRKAVLFAMAVTRFTRAGAQHKITEQRVVLEGKRLRLARIRSSMMGTDDDVVASGKERDGSERLPLPQQPNWADGLMPHAVEAVREEAIRRLRNTLGVWAVVKLRKVRRRLAMSSLINQIETLVTAVKGASDIFSQWPTGTLRGMLAAGQLLEYTCGEAIIYDGEAYLPGIYVLATGTCWVIDNTKEKADRLRTVKAPQIFGDATFFIKEPSAIKVRVASQSAEFLFLPGSIIQEAEKSMDAGSLETILKRVLAHKAHAMAETLPMTPAMLRRSVVLSDLSNKELRQLAKYLVPHASYDGEVVSHPTQNPRRAIFFVRRGKLVMVGREGERLNTLRSASAIGDHSFLRLTEPPHLKASGVTVFWVLHRADFLKFLDVSGESARQRFAAACSRMKRYMMPSGLCGCLLRAVPLYYAALRQGVLTDGDVCRIAALCTPKIFTAGAAVVSLSSQCKYSILFLDGQATATDPVDHHTRRIGFGECLAAAMLVPSRWISPVVAVTECQCWMLSRAALQVYIKEHLSPGHRQAFIALSKQYAVEERELPHSPGSYFAVARMHPREVGPLADGEVEERVDVKALKSNPAMYMREVIGGVVKAHVAFGGFVTQQREATERVTNEHAARVGQLQDQRRDEEAAGAHAAARRPMSAVPPPPLSMEKAPSTSAHRALLSAVKGKQPPKLRKHAARPHTADTVSASIESRPDVRRGSLRRRPSTAAPVERSRLLGRMRCDLLQRPFRCAAEGPKLPPRPERLTPLSGCADEATADPHYLKHLPCTPTYQKRTFTPEDRSSRMLAASLSKGRDKKHQSTPPPPPPPCPLKETLLLREAVRMAGMA